MTRKIVIFSGKQFCGKDTLAQIMLEQMPEFKRFAMGDVIKKTYSEQSGISIEEIEANKAFYRPALIELGNWGRKQDPDFWLKKIIEQDGNISVTDVRMKHEYKIFKSAGAISIRIEVPREIRAKRGQLVNENDITETDLDEIKDWDFIIYNDKGIDELKQTANALIKELKNGF